MAGGIQLIGRPGGENAVVLDGRIVGELRTVSGDSVIWRPWFGRGSFRMTWAEFCRTLSPV